MYHHRLKRCGVSLVEMLLAMAVLGIMALALSALATTVHSTSGYVQHRGEAIQHARVACERIDRAIASAHATANYPGAWVIATLIGTTRYPDALVVWRPTGAATNAAGPPLMRELVWFTFDPSAPHKLLEITCPADNRSAPALTSAASWATELAAIHTASDSVKVQLTDLLRTGDAGTSGAQMRGVIRFETRLRPSAAEWSSYQGGSLAWNQLSWAQDIYSADSGLRQTWCRYELQLVPRDQPRSGGDTAALALPALGSAAIYYSLTP